ncbi:MAG: dephospho-CoA kinase [Butyrivibrio sp.]|nr:dephospho-CoA kinase [Butyrivibrio sp.]
MKQNKLVKGRTNIIGITGGVGAGKSSVLDIISRSYNARIILSDDVANDIKKKGCPAYSELISLLGDRILGDDQEIDRKKMAEAIFGDPILLKKVNMILHPAVNTYILDNIRSERESRRYDFVFVEAALLIENGYKDIVDELWYVYADEDIRRDRLRRFRGYSDEKISDIFARQLDDDSFRKNCDFVIDNSGSLNEAFEQVDNRLKSIGEW